jgi:hypothetical protein
MRARYWVLVAGFVLGVAGSSAAGPEDHRTADGRDGDADGLTDFEEVHKYRTDPAKADTDADGIPDGDREERREFTYSIRCVVAHVPPAEAVSDLWQDAREFRRDTEAVELEITAYPFATPGDEPSGTRADGLAVFTKPNLTSDFDDAMRSELVAALEKEGIDPRAPLDAERVQKVAQWALRRVRMGKTGFTICYVTAKGGRLTIVDGLEQVFHESKSDAARSLEAQLDIEARGRSMYRQATCGSCTSAGVYLQTVFRALGVPTRTTVGMPPIDVNDRTQLDRLRRALRPSTIREPILVGAADGGGWVEHTFNEVFVAGRWRRLNYARLDQPIVDREYLGLMLRILTYDDRATAGTAVTWGRRYGLGLRSERFPTGNPYRLLAASDLLGPHADLVLDPGSETSTPAPAPERRHAHLTITAARWSEHREKGVKLLELHCAEWFDDQDGDQYKRFTEQADLRFVLESAGHPDVAFDCGVGSFTGPGKHGAIGVLPDAVFERLVPGTNYRVVPRNEKPAFLWTVKPEVVIAR